MKDVSEHKSFSDTLHEKSGDQFLYLILCVVLSMTAFAVAFLAVGMGPGQRQIFMSGDLYMEYAAVNRLFWRNLLDGNSLTYSFSMGMGMPAFPTYAYDCLSPVHILFALIPDGDIASFIVVMIKTGISAGVFYVYARRCLKAEAYMAAASGMCYSMCGYVIGAVCHIAFLDAVYLLPQLVLFLKYGLRTGKYALLAIAYAWSFMTMFYTGYMLGIFTAVLFLTFLLSEQGMSGREKLHHIVRYALAALVGVLLSAAVTLPTAYYIFSNQAEDATAWRKVHFHIFDLLSNLYMGQFQGYDGHVPMVYCGVGALLTVVLTLPIAIKKVRRNAFMLIPVIFLLLCVFVKPFYLMIHGFDMPDTFEFRFSFMISFMMLSAAVKCLGLEKIRLRKKVITAVALGGIYAAIFLLEKLVGAENANGMSAEVAVVNLVFLLVWSFLLSVKADKMIRRLSVVVFTALEMAVNAFLCHNPDDESDSRKRDFYEEWSREGDAVAEGMELDDENAGAFRVYFENVQSPNDSAYFGYRGLGYFYSSEQPFLRTSLSHLGYASTPRAVCDYGSTPVTRMLFAQRYLVHGTDLRYESADKFSVNRNRYVLPMAYMVSDDLEGYTPGKDPFTSQNMLLNMMLGGKGKNVYRLIDDAPVYREEGIILTETGEGILLRKEDGVDTAKIVYHLQSGEEGTVYGWFDPVIRGWWGDSALLVSEMTDTGMAGWDSTLSFSHIMLLGKDSEGYEVSVFMTPQTVSEQYYKKAYFAAFDPGAFVEDYQELAAGGVRITEFSDGYMRCYAGASKEKSLLFTGIPFDEGWEATVDGVETEIRPVIERAFMAVALDEGEHEVILRYKAPVAKIGRVLSLVGVVVMLGVSIYSKKVKNKGKERT